MRTGPGCLPPALHEKTRPSVQDHQPLQIHPLFQQQIAKFLLPGQWKGDVDCGLQEPSSNCITCGLVWKCRLPGPTPDQLNQNLRLTKSRV